MNEVAKKYLKKRKEMRMKWKIRRMKMGRKEGGRRRKRTRIKTNKKLAGIEKSCGQAQRSSRVNSILT